MKKNKTDLETNWDRLMEVIEGAPIPRDTEDGPKGTEASHAWFAQADLVPKGNVVRRRKRGPQKSPTKKLVSLRLSPEVIDHFKAAGQGWQTRIDSTLRESIKKRA